MQTDNKEDKKDLNKAIYDLGFALGVLGIAILIILAKHLIKVVLIGAVTWVIFWCFGWEWNILIPVGVYLLALLIQVLSGGR